MDKAFSPAEIEPRIYERWEAGGYFEPSGRGPTYSIVIPPPNVTGTLHMGHAFQDTIMDALIRHRRMLGFDTLWQPGTDHAGIATQMVVERQLNAAGRSRLDLGREAFVAKVWEWKNTSGGTIARQMRRLGASVDWTRDNLHHGSGTHRGRHRGLRTPVSRRIDLPRQAAGELGSRAQNGTVGSGGRLRRGIGSSLAREVSAARRQRPSRRRDDTPGDHVRRHRGGRSSRGRALPALDRSATCGCRSPGATSP